MIAAVLRLPRLQLGGAGGILLLSSRVVATDPSDKLFGVYRDREGPVRGHYLNCPDTAKNAAPPCSIEVVTLYLSVQAETSRSSKYRL